MTLALVIFAIGTLLFIAVLVAQWKILSKSNGADPLLNSKLFFFLFNLFHVLTTLTLACGVLWSDKQLLIPASVFYTISASIAVWTYYKRRL